MKKILLFAGMLIMYVVGIAQPISQRSTSPVTVQDARLFAQFNFRPPAFRDTIEANQNIGLDSCGALIFSRDINAYYYRACSPKRWVAVTGGQVANAWLLGGNTSPTSTNFGTIDNKEITFITNGQTRMRIAGTGINRSTTARQRYLSIDTASRYLYYTDGTDTTSLSNRINSKIDSLKRNTGTDSVFGRINGQWVFQYIDSSGGSGTVTSISQGYGIIASPNPITTTGTISADTIVLNSRYMSASDTSRYVQSVTSLTDTSFSVTKNNSTTTISIVPNLQTVLNKGNLSYQKSILIIDSVNTGSSANTVAVLSSKDSIRGSTSPYFVGLEKRFTTNYATLEFDKTTYTNKLLPILKLSSSDLDKEFRATSEKLFFKKLSGGGTTFYVQPPNTLTNNTLTLPNTTGTLIAKINGNSPDSTGNITISTGSGTVTSVATGYGLSGGTITTTGTLIVDTSASGLSGKYVRISDSSSMLSPYLRKVDTASLSNRINLKLNISDTSSMLSPYLRKVDTASLSNRINLKVNISDTSSMLSPYLRKIDTTNKWVNNITRTAGKDSIIYYIGSTRYAIKDSVGTNPPASGYYGAFQDNNTQTAAASNVGYPMKLRTNDLTNGITITGSDTSRITFANTGIYNLQFSSQFQNTNNQLADVTIWLRLNGTDVAGSSGFLSVPNSHGSGASNYGHTIASWNYVLSVVAGQYYEIVWSTTNHTNVTMEFYAAGNPPPSTASVIVTVTQQAGILAGTGITAINSLTGSAQTMVTGTDSTDFKIVSTGTSHTFNLPTASATNTGKLSSANWTTFNNKIGPSDTASMLANYVRNVPTIAYLGSDFTTSSTTAVSSNLSIAVAANTAYRIMINGTASKATSSTGLKVGITAPTGTTIKANFNYCTNSINTQNNTFITAINTLYPAAANFSTAIATEMPFRIEGILVTGSTAGNVVLQGATVTSNTATIYANTLMTLTKAYSQ